MAETRPEIETRREGEDVGCEAVAEAAEEAVAVVVAAVVEAAGDVVWSVVLEEVESDTDRIDGHAKAVDSSNKDVAFDMGSDRRVVHGYD